MREKAEGGSEETGECENREAGEMLSSVELARYREKGVIWENNKVPS